MSLLEASQPPWTAQLTELPTKTHVQGLSIAMSTLLLFLAFNLHRFALLLALLVMVILMDETGNDNDNNNVKSCSFQFIYTFRYCGSVLDPTGSNAAGTSSPIVTCDKPFRMFFQTGVLTPANTAGAAGNAVFSSGVHTAAAAGANVQGFQFTYRQLPGNC